MEVIGCCRAIYNLHISLSEDIFIVVIHSVKWYKLVLIAKLEVSLGSGRWVLWTCTIVSVRQQHYKAVLHIPFCLTRCNELIDNNLGTISKITELRFPKSQTIWIGLCISKLVTKHSELREMWVRGNEPSIRSLWHCVIYRIIITISILVKNMSVSMRESSSFDVLSWNSNIKSILNQRRESEGFCSSPVNVFATFNCLLSCLKYFFYKPMEISTFW